MEKRLLRESGIEVTVVGLGTNNFGLRIDEAQSHAVVDAALECGINFFDTGDVYGGGDSERFLGAALKRHRDDVVVATKFGQKATAGVDDDRPGGSRAYVRDAVNASLERLGMDYVDVLYYHKPDGVTPLEETMGAMWDLVDEGKTRTIACSNVTVDQISESEAIARAAGRPHFVCVQNAYNLVDKTAEKQVLPLCERLGIGFVPFSPLANGVLTGKYERSESPPPDTRLGALSIAIADEQWDAAETALRFGKEHGWEPIDMAIGSLLARRVVSSVIAGATTPEQVRANAAAADATLGVADLLSLDAVLARPKVADGSG